MTKPDVYRNCLKLNIDENRLSANHTEEYDSFRYELARATWTSSHLTIKDHFAHACVFALEYYAYTSNKIEISGYYAWKLFLHSLKG